MEITVCGAADVALLDRYLGSPGATSFHARRFARQEAGECTYLVAWLDGRPVGHTEMRWLGCAAPEVPRVRRPVHLPRQGTAVRALTWVSRNA